MKPTKIKVAICIAAVFSSGLASSAAAQSTDGEDAISSLTGLFASTAEDTFGSEGVKSRIVLSYSEIETNSWILTDTLGNDFEGSDIAGRSISIGRDTKGTNAGGYAASYGWGGKLTELGDDTTDINGRFVGGYVDGGFGYGTGYGVDLTLHAEADLSLGKLTHQNIQYNMAPFTLGLKAALSYTYSDIRLSGGIGRYFTDSGFLSRTRGEEVLDEFAADTTRIHVTVGFDF